MQDQLAELRVFRCQRLGPEQGQILHECSRRLRMARWCIEGRAAKNGSAGSRPGWFRTWRRWPPFTENNTLFWNLVHRNDEDILLLVPHEELLVRALDILGEFRRNIRDGQAVRQWLTGETEGPLPRRGLLTAAVDELRQETEKEFHLQGPRLDHLRYILREALHVVNSHTDRSFRQLAANVLIRSWSGMMLLVLLGLLVAGWTSLAPMSGAVRPSLTAAEAPQVDRREAEEPETVVFLLLLLAWGATGAVAANLASKSPFPVALGPTRRYFVLYLLARPILGAFAALLLYLLVQGGFLGLGPDGAGVSRYAFAALAVTVGFSTEKFLGPIMDRGLLQLRQRAEKSEETPRPAAGPGDDPDEATA
jgi:hypothetical protein